MAVYVGLTVVNNLCLVIALVYCLIVTPCSLLSSLYEGELPIDGNFASTYYMWALQSVCSLQIMHVYACCKRVEEASVCNTDRKLV